MKPILMNINEMSDSKEVYDSKPNIFFTIFIYLILGIIIIALIWMYFGRIDVVVKSDAMIRPNNQVATVANTYSGKLENVNIKDGDYVEVGNVLYTIEHEDLLTDLTYYKEQLRDLEENLSLLNKYKKSVEDGKNYFKNDRDEEEYYLKFLGYYINYETIKKDYSYSDKEREMNLGSTSEQLQVLQEKLKYTELLRSAINKGKNLFSKSGEELEYYNRYLKYVSDYDTIVNKYNSAKTEIDQSTTKEGLLNTYDYYSEMLKGLKLLYSSVKKDENLFEKTSSYSLQYEEYVDKKEELVTEYEQAKGNYELNKELEGIAVTEQEVEQSKTSMEEAKRAINTYKVTFLASITTSITDTEKNRKEAKLAKDNTQSKEELYKQNAKDKIAAIENFKLQYIVELDTSIATLKENILTLKTNKGSLELQREKTYLFEEDNNKEGSLVELRNSELRTTIDRIRITENQINEIETTIDKLNTQIDSAVVKATKSGIVNSYVELVEGDNLASGTEVLSIIPGGDSQYKANIYVSNADIGKLSEGMKVKFNVYALPNSEYGYLTGTITKISKDIKADSNASSSYYLVEANLDNKKLYDSKGEEAKLKAGMTCQAQMITERKRILTFVLEKINFIN